MKFEIDLDPEKAVFESYLSQGGNVRIFFSGIFGSGKTTFIRNFFDNHESYIPIHIFPINYAVSKNEDIFELIKFDILYEILDRKPKLENVDASVFDALSFINAKDIYSMLKPFISIIPVIGKKTLDIIEPLEAVIRVVKEKLVEVKDLNEAVVIKRFAEKMQMTAGSIYEYDFHSQLIISLVNALKAQQKKETVLIVDDLDRIDPEHIFRILNIFAAHFDSKYYANNNKFELDKIILCGDLQNIRRIFINKYGKDVDFNGYIDKFFSKDVFYFDSKRYLVAFVKTILSSIKIYRVSEKGRRLSSMQVDFLTKVVSSAISSNVLGLRSLKIWTSRNIFLPKTKCFFGNRTVDFIPAIELFQLLENFLQGREAISETLQQINFEPVNESPIKRSVFSWLLLFADHKNHKFKNNVDLITRFDDSEYVYATGSNGDTFTIASINEGQLNNEVDVNYKELLIAAFEVYANSKL